MLKEVITFLRPSQSLKGRLGCEAEAIVWKYNPTTGKFFNPKTKTLQFPHRVPTGLSKDFRHQHLVDCVTELTRQVMLNYGDEYRKVELEVEKHNHGTKKRKELEEKRRILGNFLDRVPELIRLEGPFRKHPSSRYRSYHVFMPFIDKSLQQMCLSQQFLAGSRYNSVSRQGNYEFGMPFGMLEVDLFGERITRQQPDLEHLLNAPIVAYDIETHNWWRIEMREQLEEMSTEDLEERLKESIELYGEDFEEEDWVWFDRRDYIREIERLVNENKDEHVTSQALSVDPGHGEPCYNYVVTVLDDGKAEFDVTVPGTNMTEVATEFLVADRYEAARTVTRLMHLINPFYVTGHNQMKFDYVKADLLSRPSPNDILFLPGVDNRPPLFVSQTPGGGFVKQVIIPGRIDIDPAGISQNLLHLRNNKLDSVHEEVCGVLSPKFVASHGLLPILTEEAYAGNKESAFNINYYCVEDTIKSRRIARALLKPLLLYAEATGSSVARLCATAGNTIGEDYWVQWHWWQKRTYPFAKEIKSRYVYLTDEAREIFGIQAPRKAKPRDSKLTYEKFSPVKYLHHKLNQELEQRAEDRVLDRIGGREGLEDLDVMDRHDLMKDVKKAKREARIKAKQGLFTGMHTEFFPFAYAFKPLLEKDPKVKAMYDEIKATDSYVTKTILMKGIEWMAKYPLFRLLDPDIGERLFAAEFQLGFSGKEKEAFQKRLDRAVKVLAGLVDDAGMHNVNQRIFIIPDETEDERLKWARKAGVLIEKGKGLFYSGTKGRFASNIDGQFNMHGIADYVSNKGERCTFEKQFYKVWIRKLVMENDKRGALEYLVERCRQLAIGEVSKYEAGWGLLEYQVDKALKIAERKLAKLKDGHKDKGKSPLEYFVETANNIPEPLFGELEHQIVRTLKLAETELIERGSEEEKALGTLGYLIARAEDLTKSEKSENPLQYERTAARDHNAFSGVSAVRHKAFMAKQRIRKGEIVRYEYSLDEMQAKFFGVMSQEVKLQCKKYDLYLDAEDVYDKELVAYNKKQKAGLGMTLFPEPKPKAPERVEKPLIASMKQGTISEIVRWAFNFKQGSEGRDILDRIYVGDGTQEDVNALLNLIGEENVVSINRYIRPGTA